MFKRIREQYHRVAIEPRLSIYGRKMNEWENLSKWFVDHKVLSCDEENAGKASGHVKWMIQVHDYATYLWENRINHLKRC